MAAWGWAWLGAAVAMGADSVERKVVLLAGRASHGKGEHEFKAGCEVLAAALAQIPGFKPVVVTNGWPTDASVFDGARAVVMYADGGNGHPAIAKDRLALLDALSAKGVGIAALHYGVEVPKGDPGEAMLRWTGGYFETFWSVNPTWTARFESLPVHPVTRGVAPFEARDEWYYHMRFVPQMKGVTPILAVLPPADTLQRPDGPHSGNPHVRKEAGLPQHVAWVSENAEGGRGCGFTGGHDHWNWGNDNFRRVVLNAIVWSSHGEVPAGGVGGDKVDLAELQENQDYPKPENYDWKRAEERISKELK
jgi:hypothetical protein